MTYADMEKWRTKHITGILTQEDFVEFQHDFRWDFLDQKRVLLDGRGQIQGL